MCGIVIPRMTLGISHIPIHLAIIAYNIAQCYTIHQMPPTFAKIKGIYFVTPSPAFSVIFPAVSLRVIIIIY